MPKILDRLVTQLEAQGYPKSSAYPIAISQLQKSGNLKKGTIQPTIKGLLRGQMTPSERAKDRASKKSGHKPTEYSYNKKSNTVKLR